MPRILIADDTRFFCAILEDILTAKGHDVITAYDGLEALKLAKKEIMDLDLVLLDILMPKMDGFEVLREIRRLDGGEDLPVIAITGVFKRASELESLRKLGVVGYITKNSTPEEIVEKVNEALESKEGLKEDLKS